MKHVSILFFLILFTIGQARAVGIACTTSPFLNKMDFSGDLQYCVGDQPFSFMMPVGGTSTGSTCLPAETGTFKYQAGIQIYCDGANWITATACPPTAFICDTPGKLVGSVTGPIVCNGSNWNTIDTSCPALSCADFLDLDTCSTASPTFACYWLSTGCIDATATCSSIFSALACNATLPCTWSMGTCGTAY